MTSSPDPLRLDARTWEDAGRPTVFVPVGSFEQHGPHLPFDTDTRVAVAVAARLAESFQADGTDAVVAPAIAYGASGEHQDFPGTISIGSEALGLLVLEFGRSICGWADRVVFVNGHGGNVDALARAIPRLRVEGRDASWLACTVDSRDVPSDYIGDAHGGRTETSLIEYLHPDGIRRGRIEPGNTAALVDLLPRLRAAGVRKVAPNGILGDPSGATAEEGRALLDAISATALRRLQSGVIAADGRLTG